MVDVSYVTAKNLFHPENSPPHIKLSVAVLREARGQMGDIRKSIVRIMDYASGGAKDLLGGDCWSDNIDMFESLSMDQARALSKFPVGTSHPKLGPRVFHARAAFVAFRESVRWEIIGKVRPGMTDANYDEILSLVTEYARQTTDSMVRVEKALENMEVTGGAG